MSFVWKVEDMALMNEKSNIYIGNEKIYKAENKLTRQEKIDFLDSMNDGLTSYILNLADKLKEDKENGVIKKDTYGEMKAISYIAWINRNDTRNCVDSIYDRGSINFTPYRKINMLNTNISMFRGSTYSDYVNEAFHLQLKNLENQEKQYFREHDEYEILKTKISKYSDKYGTFGLNIWKTGRRLSFYKNDNANSAERQITLDELKLLNNKYEEMDKFYAKITAELPYIDYDHEYKSDKGLLNRNDKIPDEVIDNFINKKIAIKIDNQEQANQLVDKLRKRSTSLVPEFYDYDPNYPYFYIEDDYLDANKSIDNLFKLRGIESCVSFSNIVRNLDYDTAHEESEEENTTITEVVEDYLDKSEIDLD